MELFIFARFHAHPGHESAVEKALRDVVGIGAFRSIRDPQLFYIHSRWKDEAAFEIHAAMPHTLHFLERVAPLIDHPLDVTRAERIG